MPAYAEPRYIPAARWRIFTRLYDPVLALAMRERRFRHLMCQRVSADLPREGIAADVGCGTGTFAVALASQRTDAKVVGVDGDTEILGRRKTSPAPMQSYGMKGWHRSSRWAIRAPTSSRCRWCCATSCPRKSGKRWPR